MSDYCALCSKDLKASEDEVCRGCELGDEPKLTQMSDEDFINQIQLPEFK